ncbi:hypothetical protein [Bacillus sp. 1P06AnD]|uniref:hypothetical protein n=1 Tax=Bacillus sp. 1P06AnD TaxID=3132208 RepID=UPI00399FBB2A
MEKFKKNMVAILLSINLVLGLLATAGVTYLIVQQQNGPERGEQMGNRGTPPQMNQNQDQNQNNSTSGSSSDMQ